MAVFCSSCGTSMTEGTKFCPACGAAAAAPGGSAAPVSTAPTSSPATSAPPAGGGALKIVLIVLGILAFLGMLMIGSCFYIGYKVKKAAGDFASHSKPYTGTRAPCSFVSASEAADALGVPVQDAVPRGTMGCDYTLGTDGNHLMVQFAWQGGTGMMRLAHGAMKMGGATTFTDVPGLGDEAFLAPGDSTLIMRKGDVLVTINLQASGLSADGAKKLAAQIANRLGE